MENPKNNTAIPIKQSSQTLKIPRTFEILIEEMHEDDNGTVRWRPLMIDPRLGGNGTVTITVNSDQELREKQQWYKQAGQRFKIIRELNPPTRADIERMAAEQHIEINQPAQKPSEEKAVPPPAPEKKPVKTASKIITLGDVQIKYDGDSVYQRQWVRLSPKEEANIRVISDANNKLIPMKGRHFEVKRWVKIEGGSVLDETSDDF